MARSKDGIVEQLQSGLGSQNQASVETPETQSERRQYPRHTALYHAKYTIKSGTYRDLISNVSADGIYINTWRTIKHGQRISLRFPVMAFDRRPEVVGSVVRSQDRGFAVMFDNPIEEMVCQEGQYDNGEGPGPANSL